MSDSTRRGFLKYAGAGVAAAGVAAVVPTGSADAAPVKSGKVSLPKGASGSMVAYISDLHSGEMAVMVEGREVNITDHELVARLAHHLHADRSAL